jgi:hypothetical protein
MTIPVINPNVRDENRRIRYVLLITYVASTMNIYIINAKFNSILYFIYLFYLKYKNKINDLIKMSLGSIKDLCLYYIKDIPESLTIQLESLIIPKNKILNIVRNLWTESCSSKSPLSLFRIIYNTKDTIPKDLLKDLYWIILLFNIGKCYPNIFTSIYDSVKSEIKIKDMIVILKSFESYQLLHIYKTIIHIFQKYTKIPFCRYHIYREFNETLLGSTSKLSQMIICMFEIHGFSISNEIFENDWIDSNDDNKIKHEMCQYLPKLGGSNIYTNDFLDNLEQMIINDLVLKKIEWILLCTFELPNRDIIQRNMTTELTRYILNDDTTLIDIASTTKQYKCLKLLQTDIGSVLIRRVIDMDDDGLNYDSNYHSRLSYNSRDDKSSHYKNENKSSYNSRDNKSSHDKNDNKSSHDKNENKSSYNSRTSNEMIISRIRVDKSDEIYQWYMSDKSIPIIILSECVVDDNMDMDKFYDLYKCRTRSLLK